MLEFSLHSIIPALAVSSLVLVVVLDWRERRGTEPRQADMK